MLEMDLKGYAEPSREDGTIAEKRQRLHGSPDYNRGQRYTSRISYDNSGQEVQHSL
ncbi:hypothetical protein PaeBR_22850 [Paenibacillus sp. BR2-3]|uniref:hypothetical protein n=1 Tax=Paenibacillus sp. BR2-3 TaxID=3048494 RepID=UPI003977C54B